MQPGRGVEALISLSLTLVLMDGKPPKKLTYGGEFWEVANKKSMLASLNKRTPMRRRRK